MQDKEDLLRAIFESTQDAIIILDDKMCCLRANPSAGTITGIPHEQLIGRFLQDFVDASFDLASAWSAFILTGRFAREVAIKHNEGGFRTVETTGIANILPGQHLFIGHDITERNRTEEALLQSEEKYRQLVEGSGSIILRADKEMRITYMNQYGLQFFGYSPEEILGKRALGTIIPIKDDEGHDIAAMAEDLMRHPDKYPTNVHQNMRKDGSLVWVSWANKPIYDNQGNLIELLVVGNDISKLKETEAALLESEQRYRRIVETAEEGIATHEPDGTITYVNQRMADMLGYSREEMIGRLSLDFVDDEEREAVIRARESLKEQGSFSKEWKLYRKDGSILWTLANATLRRDDAGNFIGYLAMHTDITERKKAEEALCQSQSMLARAEKIANIGSWEWDIRSGEQIWSEQTYRIFGLEPEQSTPSYKSFLAYIHPGYRQLVEQAIEDALSGKKPYDIEYQILTPRSTTCWAHSRGVVVFDENGQPASMIGTMLDITERKLMEIALQESEEKFRLVADFTYDWETWLDPEGNYNFVSPSCERITGHRADEFVKDPQLAIDIVHPDDREAFKAHRNMHLKGQISSGQIDYRIVTKNGETRWISHLCQPIFGRNGEWLGRRASNRDITDRKKAEEALCSYRDELELRVQERTAELEEANKALYSSEQRLVLAQKAGGVGVYDWNVVTGEIIWTPELEKVYGMPAPANTKERQKAWLSCIHPEDLQQALEIKKQWLESTQNVLEGEYRIIRPDGQERWITGSHLAIRDSDNRPLRVIGTQIDFTERKMIENELRKAKKAAEAAAEAKAAFMANMSHELRTPMNYIIGMTSLLLEEPLTPELKDYIETIRKGGDEMMALINNILDFSKVEKEELVLEYHLLSLRALVEDSLDAVASQAARKSLNLASTIKHGTPDNIIGDHGRLSQVLTNLLSNAVKFTDEGEISVSVSSKPLQKTNMYQILFTVKDTGIGIPPEKMGELFQPFSQVETELSQKRDGIGLGLAANKKLVELMGGEIWAKSEVGKGSTFYFTIEAEIAPNEDISIKPKETVRAIPEDLAENNPLRILIAEDTPSNQKVILEMLKRMGYKADVVADGKEVLQALETRPYDLILMDVKMPEMNGIEATKEIRQRWPNDVPKIIAITAYALEGDREKCLEAGMDDYIAKPVKKEDLVKVLAKNG